MRKKVLYGAILLAPLLGGVSARLLRVIIAFMLRDSGVSVFEITLLSSSFMLSRAIFSPLLGKLADRGFKRHLLIMVGFAGLLVDATLYMVIPYPEMFALRVMDGIFSAMVWPTLQAVVHFSTPKGLKARVMSIYFIMGSLGMSIGYVLYSAIGGNIVYAITLIVVVYAVEIVTSLAFRDVKEEHREVVRERIKVDRLLYSLTFLFGMYMSLGNEVLLFYLAEVLNLGKVYATLILFAGGLFSLLGSFMVSHIADKRGFSRAIILLSAISFISALLISISYLYIAILGTFLFFVAGRGFMPVSRSFTASSTRKVGTSLGYVNLSSNLGSVVGPLIGGIIIDSFHDVQWGVFNLAALSFLAVSALIPILNIIMLRRG